MKVCGILVAAGSGKRLGAEKNKTLMPLSGRPLFLYALRALQPFCSRMILVIREKDREEFREVLASSCMSVDQLVIGGQERRHSVENALKVLPQDIDLVLVHDAARPFVSPRLIEDIIEAAARHGAAVPALPVNDTLRKAEAGGTATVSRDGLYQVQTPQGFTRDILLKAYAANNEALTDDAGLVEQMGHPVQLVQGDARNIKITRGEDWGMAQQLLGASMRIGTGFDTHRLVEGRDLVLGGVTIPHSTGLLGHSDADVALHALTDALLGACALGDIGQHFPDSRAQYKGVSSLKLLEETVKILHQKGFLPWQCDLTIIAQKPKLAPFMDQMRHNIASVLHLPIDRVSVKATTTEGLGFEGREEGISAQAAVLVHSLE